MTTNGAGPVLLYRARPAKPHDSKVARGLVGIGAHLNK